MRLVFGPNSAFAKPIEQSYGAKLKNEISQLIQAGESHIIIKAIESNIDYQRLLEVNKENFLGDMVNKIDNLIDCDVINILSLIKIEKQNQRNINEIKKEVRENSPQLGPLLDAVVKKNIPTDRARFFAIGHAIRNDDGAECEKFVNKFAGESSGSFEGRAIKAGLIQCRKTGSPLPIMRGDSHEEYDLLNRMNDALDDEIQRRKGFVYAKNEDYIKYLEALRDAIWSNDSWNLSGCNPHDFIEAISNVKIEKREELIDYLSNNDSGGLIGQSVYTWIRQLKNESVDDTYEELSDDEMFDIDIEKNASGNDGWRGCSP